jgi:hypothetical protein
VIGLHFFLLFSLEKPAFRHGNLGERSTILNKMFPSPEPASPKHLSNQRSYFLSECGTLHCYIVERSGQPQRENVKKVAGFLDVIR